MIVDTEEVALPDDFCRTSIMCSKAMLEGVRGTYYVAAASAAHGWFVMFRATQEGERVATARMWRLMWEVRTFDSVFDIHFS